MRRISSSVSLSLSPRRRPRYRIQHIDRHAADAQISQRQCHIDPVLHSFAQSHDSAAAYRKPGRLRRTDRPDLVVKGMRRADMRKIPSGGFQIVVDSRDARLFQLSELCFWSSRPKDTQTEIPTSSLILPYNPAHLLHFPIRQAARPM